LLQETIGFFLSLDRIVAVYEMADPLLNSHNMNLLFESESEIWIEVVGPGFDASDLQRGDVSPHEAFSVQVPPGGTPAQIKLIDRVDQEAYEDSVTSRKSKIKRKLDSSPEPGLARRIRENLGIPDDLEAYLRRIDSPLCRLQAYQPISETLVMDTVRAVLRSGVIARYSDATGARFPLVFATSLVNRGTRQVYWDIVSPLLKFESLARNP